VSRRVIRHCVGAIAGIAGTSHAMLDTAKIWMRTNDMETVLLATVIPLPYPYR
jgi:hypothetical protein